MPRPPCPISKFPTSASPGQGRGTRESGQRAGPQPGLDPSSWVGVGRGVNRGLPASGSAARPLGAGLQVRRRWSLEQAPARGLAPSGPAPQPGSLPCPLLSSYSLAGGGEKREFCIHGVLSGFSGLSALTRASSGSLSSPPTEKWPSGRGEDGVSGAPSDPGRELRGCTEPPAAGAPSEAARVLSLAPGFLWSAMSASTLKGRSEGDTLGLAPSSSAPMAAAVAAVALGAWPPPPPAGLPKAESSTLTPSGKEVMSAAGAMQSRAPLQPQHGPAAGHGL